MATKSYSIIDLLQGQFYRSRSRHIEGIIQSAERRESVWYGKEYEAYLVRVRPHFNSDNPKSWGKDFYATVAVKVGE